MMSDDYIERYLFDRFDELLEKEPNLSDEETEELDTLGTWFDAYTDYADSFAYVKDYYGFN